MSCYNLFNQSLSRSTIAILHHLLFKAIYFLAFFAYVGEFTAPGSLTHLERAGLYTAQSGHGYSRDSQNYPPRLISLITNCNPLLEVLQELGLFNLKLYLEVSGISPV